MSLKLLVVQEKAWSKVISGQRELSDIDLVEIPKGTTPGEWIVLENTKLSERKFLAYVNLCADAFNKIKIVEELSGHDFIKIKEENLKESEVALASIFKHIREAISYREMFGIACNSRLVYGQNDSLPGLIVDKYKKYILVQINTAGIDRFRFSIRDYLSERFTDIKIILFDNAEYRKREILPVYEQIKYEDDVLCIEENNLKYEIPWKLVQKVGFYYDHRENRQKLSNLIRSVKINKTLGLDLFCYVGSWGMHLLNAGVKHVDFVDQAKMGEVIENHIKLNNFLDANLIRGKFYNSDVFDFIRRKEEEGSKYDVIVSDPPAFAKSEAQKKGALSGYEKLHIGAMKLLNHNSIFVVASCTQYVSYKELDSTVQVAATKLKRKIRLLDIGLQGKDHPLSGFEDRSFYIKYLVYFVQ